MALLTPTQGKQSLPQPPKSFAATKRWVSQLFFTELARHSADENGDYRTNGQMMVENVVRLATDSTGDPYVQLAAAKFITERLEGKAGVMNEEPDNEMPKLVICVGDAAADKIKESVRENEGAEPAEDIVVEIADGDGDNKGTVIV